VLLSPAVLRGLLETPAEAVLAEGWENLNRDGLDPLLVDLYRELVANTRRLGEVLGPEDVFELGQGTALLELGQRLALRQVLQAATRFETELPQRPRPSAARRDVPTQIFDEDIYPVGGYASVSTRGAIESLLPSQLAFMEPQRDLDLFTIKYVRDELLFYSRDENQFLRRRRNFVFALFADLAQARQKDVDLPWQRIVLTLGFLTAAVRTLTEWLSSDALCFEFCLVGKDESLAHERHLLELIFRTALANGTVRFNRLANADELAAHCADLGRHSLCHCLWTAVNTAAPRRIDNTELASFQIHGPSPVLEGERLAAEASAESGHLEAWHRALVRLLASWA
jgi:hypothetical protein